MSSETNNNFKNNKESSSNSKKIIELRPKLGGFLLAYVIFSLPGFIVSLITTALIVVLIFVAIVSGFSGSGNIETEASKDYTLETTKESSNDKGILIYNLSGSITTGSDVSSINRDNAIYTEIVKKDFENIKKNNNIKNIVIKMNTPGGEVFASKVLGDLLNDIRLHFNQQKLVFYYDQLVASGGVLATCKTNSFVVASKYGETGSIGVMMILPNFSGTAEKVGYKETVIKSSDKKDIYNIFRDPTGEEIKIFKDDINREFVDFKNCVSTGRNIKSMEVDNFANGLTYTNYIAKDYGLVDEVDNIDKAISVASQNAGLGQDYKVWQFKTKYNFLDTLLQASIFNNFLEANNLSNKALERINSLDTGKMYAIDEAKI